VKVFSEKISGRVLGIGRKVRAKAMEALRAGDTLIVTRLDRLARSTRDLLNVLDARTIRDGRAALREREVGAFDIAALKIPELGANRIAWIAGLSSSRR
jgi:hypothetical protein